MGSINYKEKVALLNENEYGYTNIEYGTKVGLKRGFVPYGTIKKVSNISLPSIEANSKVTKGIYGYSGKGRELAYYKIGNGPKALVSVFAIHGFEDAWASDGLELYKIAADTIKDLSNINDLNGWTAYIIPTANPDGIIEGFTNDGPGRGTVSDQMDLNRSFPKNYVAYTEGSRNYNGNRSLVAPEASSLNNFIHNKKSEHSNMVLLDVHGWENKTIGNSEIGAYFGEQFGFGHIEKYPGGFLIAEGNAIGAKSTLVELPMPNSPSDIVNRGFSQKISRAIQNIIIRNPGASTNEVDSTKITPVDAKQGKVVKVTSYLNIRSGAGNNYGIVGTLKPDQIVDLYGEVDNWYKIYLGYVSKDFIEKLKETPKPDSKPKEETTISKQGQVVNVTSHLNIRSGAGTDYGIVGTLKPNQIVDLYGKTNKWYKIYLGYVHEDFIKELENQESTPIIPINKKGRVLLENLDVIDKISVDSNVIAQLKNNKIVNVLE